ncbi:MAG: hypothetical protein LBT59_15020 [Clostridiales bacterium]|jgi:hypothetical protein|nr:hypothetical protein [Clostridiales bacterium]
MLATRPLWWNSLFKLSVMIFGPLEEDDECGPLESVELDEWDLLTEKIEAATVEERKVKIATPKAAIEMRSALDSLGLATMVAGLAETPDRAQVLACFGRQMQDI